MFPSKFIFNFTKKWGNPNNPPLKLLEPSNTVGKYRTQAINLCNQPITGLLLLNVILSSVQFSTRIAYNTIFQMGFKNIYT